MTGILKNKSFEFRHLLILLFVIIIFEFLLFFVFKFSFNSFLFTTQRWYQENSAGRVANLSAISLELLVETAKGLEHISPDEEKAIISKFNIVFRQQMMEENVEDICLFVVNEGVTYIIDDGRTLYDCFLKGKAPISSGGTNHSEAIKNFNAVSGRISVSEGMVTRVEGTNIFHSFVPFVPDGEYLGVLYLRNRLDFSSVTGRFISSYDEITIIVTTLIFLGMLVLYKLTSHTMKVRDAAQKLYYEEHNRLMTERTEHDKELVFTKRIYHANHKAEKIMGFIQQDISRLSGDKEIINRVYKYANFISRVIYDMKWYEPPIHSVRNQIYVTRINEVITFIVKNLFERVTVKTATFKIETQLDPRVPIIHINEFVIWEIIEPLVQNSIVHNAGRDVTVNIISEYLENERKTIITIKDNGTGITAELLGNDGNGVQKIFLENTSTKSGAGINAGYGCFIAYNIAKKRCGWDISAGNLSEGGCSFVITINH